MPHLLHRYAGGTRAHHPWEFRKAKQEAFPHSTPTNHPINMSPDQVMKHNDSNSVPQLCTPHPSDPTPRVRTSLVAYSSLSSVTRSLSHSSSREKRFRSIARRPTCRKTGAHHLYHNIPAVLTEDSSFRLRKSSKGPIEVLRGRPRARQKNASVRRLELTSCITTSTNPAPRMSSVATPGVAPLLLSPSARDRERA